MSDAITGLLRYVHILSGIAWVGGAFLWSMVIAPRVLKNGPPQIRRPFAEAVIPALRRFFRVAGGLTLLSGLTLVGMLHGWSDYFAPFEIPRYGLGLAFGALSAIGMAIVGFGFVEPLVKKMLATMQSINGPPTAEQQATMAGIGKRMGILSALVLLLGALAVAGMVWAVNVVR